MATSKKKINELPESFSKRLPEFRDKWLKVGLATHRVQRAEVEAALTRVYAIVDKPRPKFVIMLRSPREVLYAVAFLRSKNADLGNQVSDQVIAQVRDQVSDQVRAQVRDQVSDQVRAQVIDQVSDQVRAQVSDQVSDQVRDQVSDQVSAQVIDQVRDQVSAQVRDRVSDQVSAQVIDQVRDQVSDQVRDQVRAQVRAQVIDQVSDQVSDQVIAQVSAQVSDQVSAQVSDLVRNWWWYDFGQFDAYWSSWVDVYGELGLDTSRAQGLMEFTRVAGWSFLFWDWALVSDRPTRIHRDAQNRLHCETGPAISYPDGFAVYAVHGVRVPADIIDQPASVTVERIERESNAEVRRVMIDRYGQSRYLLDSGAKKIASDDYGILYRKEIPGDEPLVMVKVINSTAEPDGSFKDYFLRVPPTVKTAREGVAWTFKKDERDYAPALQT
jgi:hypothetical protein